MQKSVAKTTEQLSHRVHRGHRESQRTCNEAELCGSILNHFLALVKHPTLGRVFKVTCIENRSKPWRLSQSCRFWTLPSSGNNALVGSCMM